MMIWVHGNVMVYIARGSKWMIYGKERPPGTMNVFNLTKKYFIHKTCQDLKIVALLAGKLHVYHACQC